MIREIDEDWESKLNPDEILEKDGKSLVLLRGLKRLARLAGMNGSKVTHTHVDIGKFGVFQCVYTASFDDDSSWSGSADCNQQNTDGDFLNYPTAVAESRAAARCLRDALGITLMSYEEVGFETAGMPTPTARISPQVVKLIETLLVRKNIDKSTLFNRVLTSERANVVVDLKELTTLEGQEASKFLNAAKKAATPSTRDARKAELEKELKDG